MRAAIYARVSSAGQRDRHTIESQLRDLPAYVARQGWTPAGDYIDDGKSAAAGKLAGRDAFARLAADAASGRDLGGPDDQRGDARGRFCSQNLRHVPPRPTAGPAVPAPGARCPGGAALNSS